MKAGRLFIPNDNNKANVMPRIELCNVLKLFFIGLEGTGVD